MDRCPAEVVHSIFRLLEFKDISALRRTSSKYATIGLDYLTNTISFFLTEESIARAKALANHPVIRNHVTSLLVEGYVIADVGCQHSYAAHYDCGHHHDEKPQPPGAASSARERRLFDRNLAKFEQKVSQDYQQYRIMWEQQQTLIKSSEYSAIGRNIAEALPKLEQLSLQTTPRCSHHVSARIREVFYQPRAMPMDGSSEYSVVQLKHLVAPQSHALLGLKKLVVECISPSFFSEVGQTTLNQVFGTLQHINLTLRLSPEECPASDDEYHGCYDDILGTMLRDALAVARDLEHLAINVLDPVFLGPAFHAKSILGDTNWPKLKQLDLDYFCTDEEYLASSLKRHAISLNVLLLACAKLSTGNWRSLTETFRELRLTTFVGGGVLEDSQDLHILHFVSVDSWRDEFMEITLAEELEWFVTGPIFEDEGHWHPFDEEFADLDDVKAEYGDPADSDYEYDSPPIMEDSDLASNEDEDLDESMPDIEAAD